MGTATLQDIISKTRKLTGSGNSQQITDSQIIDYINSFYLYDFPAEFRSLQLKNTFTINTIQNLDTYPFDYVHYETLEAPAYVNKRLVPLYQMPWSFYSLFFNWQQSENVASGDGTTGPYGWTVQNTPIVASVNNNPMAVTNVPVTAPFQTGSYPAAFPEPNPARVQNILITANRGTSTLNVTDDGNGNLIGDCIAGTVNYSTGTVAGLLFSATVPANAEINMSYNPSAPAIPQAILFWQNNITLRPVPDRGYTVEIVAYRRPSQVLLGSVDGSINMTGVPELLEWWETLAFGAAKKIYQDRMDTDGVALMDRYLHDAYMLNETRTYAQLGKQSIGTIFRDQLDGSSSGYAIFGGNNS